MNKRLWHLMWIPLILGLGGVAPAGVFTDNFETPRDYLTDGVAGTGWDGFIGKGPGEAVTALNASTRPRRASCSSESTGSYWSEPWTPLGPFLYKVVEGDFIATVKVTDYAGTAAAPVYHNNCGLMVRAALGRCRRRRGLGVGLTTSRSGTAATSSAAPTTTSGPRTANNGMAFNLAPWLQIERQGNMFHFRVSSDGVTWTAIGVSVVDASRFGGCSAAGRHGPGIYNTTSGYAAFDEFRVGGPLVVPRTGV